MNARQRDDAKSKDLMIPAGMTRDEWLEFVADVESGALTADDEGVSRALVNRAKKVISLKPMCPAHNCHYPATYTCRVCGKSICAHHSGTKDGRMATCTSCFLKVR